MCGFTNSDGVTQWCQWHDEQGTVENLHLTSQLWNYVRETREKDRQERKIRVTIPFTPWPQFLGIYSLLDSFSARAGPPCLAIANRTLCQPGVHAAFLCSPSPLWGRALEPCSPELPIGWQPVKGVSLWITVRGRAKWCTLYLCHNLYGMRFKQKTKI